MVRKMVAYLAIMAGALGFAVAAADANPDACLLDGMGIHAGVCVVIPCGAAGSEALELARSRDFLVHVLLADDAACDAMRQAADAARIDPHRIVAERIVDARLPHADNVTSIVLVANPDESFLQRFSAQEAVRVLQPRGKLIVLGGAAEKSGVSAERLKQWMRSGGLDQLETDRCGAHVGVAGTKAPLVGADNWSHWEHGPDNNPVSVDTVIKAPYMTQWLGQPYYIAMPAITTVAGGRIFTAMGHIAHHKREEPWLNTILARDGYNGAQLWTRKLPDGYLVHRSAFIATDDTFYMIAPDGTGCLALDPETGYEKGRITLPGDHGSWKWIAMDDGVLYALVGDAPDPAETTVVRSEAPAWSWGELSKGYYEPRVPWGFGTLLAAYDMDKGKVLWKRQESAPMDSRAMVIGGANIFFYGPDSRAGCLDKKSGDPIWINEDPQVRQLIEQPGQGLSSTPGFKSTTFCLYTPEAVLFEAQTNMNVVALSSKDGHLLWHRPKTSSNPNMIYADGNVLAGIGPDGNTLRLNVLTGETIEDLGFKKRSCARLTATSDSFFCRGWPEGITRYDRGNKTILFNGAFRPACNDGVIGANGLLYIGPWLCDCSLTLMGTAALCTAREIPKPDPARQLETNPSAPPVPPLVAGEHDWPSYRGSSARTGSASADAAGHADPVWHYRPEAAFTPTAPVTVGGIVFYAGDDGRVRAIETVRGQLLWSYATGGPIVQPPTFWNGRLYVGSGDGYVYALDAARGQLLWRFRAAPIERRIMLYGALCSTWPVNSGILVEDGIAYAAAGNIDYDGTYVYALDAVTGDLKWVNDASGYLDPVLRKGVSAQGNLTLASGRLWMAGGNVVSPAPYELASGAYAGPSPGDGSPRAPRGEEVGVFGGDFLIVGGRLRYSAIENVVNPESFFGIGLAPQGVSGAPVPLCTGRTVPAWDKDGVVLVSGRKTPPAYCTADALRKYFQEGKGAAFPNPVWKASGFEGRDVVSLLLTPSAVLAVCEVPMARNLATRWALCGLNRADGRMQWEATLPEAALPSGLAVDGEGRVFVTSMNGGLTCLGGAQAFSAQVADLLNSVQSGATTSDQAVQALESLLRNVRADDTRELVLASIRKLGVEPGYTVRKQGGITDWRIAGPVPSAAEAKADAALLAEASVDTARPLKVDDAKLEWRSYTTIETTGKVDLVTLYGDQASVAAYACASFDLPEAKDLLLKLGSNDGFKCWFNRAEAGHFDSGRSYRPDSDSLPVKGVKGHNEVLVKILQMGGAWAFSVRVTDAAGTPIDVNPIR